MNEPRFCVAQFADDVRQEVRGKFSLIGCYGEELICDRLPALLPRLCAHVRAVTPRLRPFERLVFRARLNGELLGEIEISEAQLRDAVVVAERVPELERISVNAVMAFSPLSVSEAGLLVVEAETEEGVLAGSLLKLRSAEGGTEHAA